MVPGGATVTPAAASRLGDEATVRRGAPEASRISSMPSTLRRAWDGTLASSRSAAGDPRRAALQSARGGLVTFEEAPSRVPARAGAGA
jgi:hypothetical protein